MKTILTIFTLTALCATLIYLPHSDAQHFIDGQIPDTFLKHGRGCNDIKFSPDGTTIASVGWDNTIKLWDVASGTRKNTLTGHTDWVWSVSFSPDGTTIASGGWDNTIKIWDVTSGTLKNTLTGHTDTINSVAFSPDGTTIASGSDDNTIRLWNPTTGALKDTLRGTWLTTEYGNDIVDNRIVSVAFSPDGQTLASGESTSLDIWHNPNLGWLSFFSIKLWDVASGSLKEELDSPLFSRPFWLNSPYQTGGEIYISVRGVVFSPDGSTLAGTVGRSSYVEFVNVIEEDNIALQTQIEMGSQQGEIYINFDDDLVILETIIQLWDVASGTLKATLKGKDLAARSLAFSPDGQTLASGGWDNTLQLWDVTRQSKTPKVTLSTHGNSVMSVAFSPNGSRLASGSWDGAIRLWTALPPANGDGVVNIADLVEVAQNFGQVGENRADVNGDGVVNIIDLILVAAALGEVAGAPDARITDFSILMPEEVSQWLTEAQQLQSAGPTYSRGILFLEQLLAMLTPQKTALLPNYPNPFNPETWIPYQLANPSDVSISIYATDGKLVRTLALGHHSVGIYESRSRAAYWDGRNALGEPVASGVYFYTLTAGDFTATRKMLIRK